MTRVVITIDGPAGVGKSTVAKLLAKTLGVQYLDTGATYRTLAYHALEQGVDPRNEAAVARLTRAIPLALEQLPSNGVRVLLSGRDVTRAIRTERVTEAAAIVAQHPRVRRAMVRLQRRLARKHSCVVEGRDTGSVVFPRATFKFFLTANASVRARRRHGELVAIQPQAPSVETIARQLRQRDRLDRQRAVGPLIRPADAVLVDTSTLNATEVVARMRRRLGTRSAS